MSDWKDVKKELPDTGISNVLWVNVKYEPSPCLPDEGQELYGTSGYSNEPISFFGIRKVTHWKYRV